MAETLRRPMCGFCPVGLPTRRPQHIGNGGKAAAAVTRGAGRSCDHAGADPTLAVV